MRNFRSNIPPLVREYQSRAVSNLIARIDDRPILVAPTGSGKTVILADFCKQIQPRLLWIAHRIELIDQAYRHLHVAGVRNFEVTSVQKQARRQVSSDVDMIIIDECHHVTSAGQYARLFQAGVPVIGTTATPFRLDGRGLGESFGSLVVASTTRELVEAGHLFAPTIYSHSAPDLSCVKKTAGDYNKRQLADATDRPKLVADIVETWIQRAQGLKTLAFAVDIEHSRRIVASFTASGIRAEHVDGKTPKYERQAILSRLKRGVTQIVSNVGIATEGFDLPDLDCAIMARPTASLCLWLQMIGRIMRPQGHAVILDHSGNALKHGSPLRQIEYTLEAKKRQKCEPLGLKLCKNCLIMVPVGIQICPDCGADLSPVARAKIKIEDGELVEFNDRDAVWKQLSSQYTFKIAVRRYQDVFHEYPIVIDDELIEPTKNNKRIVYKFFLQQAFRFQYDKFWASHQYRDLYGCWPTGFVNKVRAEVFAERWKKRHGIQER